MNLVSETVILELIKSKCIPILLYGVECFNVSKAELQSLDFTINRLFIKLFNSSKILLSKTASISLVLNCQVVL